MTAFTHARRLSLAWLLGLSACLPLQALHARTTQASAPQTAPAANDIAPAAFPFQDGPYVTRDAGGGWRARWMCGGQPVEKTGMSPAAVPAVCETAHEIGWDESGASPGARWQASRWAAISDVHGQFGLMKRLLGAQGVTDGSGRWAFGQGHLVIVGDVFDRGDGVTPALWWIRQLEAEAQLAGGRVHFLLGNHEVMSLGGDLRYLNPKYAAVAEALGTPYPALMGPGTVLGDWLRKHPIMTVVDDTLFVHGGVHPNTIAQGATLARINADMAPHVGKGKAAIKAEGEWVQHLFTTDGPLWTRRFLQDPLAVSDEALQPLLTHFGVKRFVVGHTTQPQIVSKAGGRVIGIDAGLKDGRQGELLVMEAGVLYRGLLDGRREVLVPAPR